MSSGIKIKQIVEMDKPIILGYWFPRGRAQVSRLLLEYTGLKWQNKAYTNGDVWFGQDKKNLGLNFPNLPYLIDGNTKVTESMVIQRYIVNRSNKKDLLGANIQDQARVDNILGVYEDILKSIFGLLFNQNFQTEKQGAMEKVKNKFEHVQKFYGNKQFALGYLTLVDFVFAQLSYYIKTLDTTYYSQFPFLDKVQKAFNNLPQIKAYYQKQGAIKNPFMPPIAKIQPVFE